MHGPLSAIPVDTEFYTQGLPTSYGIDNHYYLFIISKFILNFSHQRVPRIYAYFVPTPTPTYLNRYSMSFRIPTIFILISMIFITFLAFVS